MWTFPEPYDVIIVGGGHAGCEAALAAAQMGCSTLMLTMNLDTIAKMSCNPAIGGIGKGHMVREIDALGGAMGRATDATGIQFRMLNRTKGPAVWAPRAQCDKVAYQFWMKHHLECQEGLSLHQGSVEELLVEEGRIVGVATKEGVIYRAKAVIVSSGTFMRGLMHLGEKQMSGGRAGDRPAVGISASLESLGFELGRLKTGTPARIHARSIDYTMTEEQPGEDDVHFSFDSGDTPRLRQVSCHITYTTEATKQIIQDNLDRSAMYSGRVTSVGPRYCPSIEDKVVRFADKERHQIFLEPEGLQTEEVYANGISTSLPYEVQLEFIRSIPALRNAQITRPAYAIEYDYVVCGQVHPTLESRPVEGLYLAGQVNGTTGYEEAAAQGLMAGINAARKIRGEDPFILGRHEAYIGVMIDDLITKPLKEPYRMFTSRAEHRLLLRQDNADLRLREYGYQMGLVDEPKYQRLVAKRELLDREQQRLSKTYVNLNGKGHPLSQVLARPESRYDQLCIDYPEYVKDHGEEINQQIELSLKYAGYIRRQEQEVARLSHVEGREIPTHFDYHRVIGLRNEARQKLAATRPATVGQATRVEGVSPADISILLVALQK